MQKTKRIGPSADPKYLADLDPQADDAPKSAA